MRKLADAVPEAPARNVITFISSAVVPLAARAQKVMPMIGSWAADSDGSRPLFRDDLARHSDLISLGIPR
jgi:hypothetical protein